MTAPEKSPRKRGLFRLRQVPAGAVALRFDGRGSEYFRIWMADILCLMLSFGLYWPWLRRRRWRYLNGHTWLGERSMGNPEHATERGAWPSLWQQGVVVMLILGLRSITRRFGVLGWPMLLGGFSFTGPWWLKSGWAGRVAQWRIGSGAPVFNGHLLLACGVWLLVCLMVLPAGVLVGALFLDNLRIWLLGSSWLARGLSDTLRAVLPLAAGLSVALALSGWHYSIERFGLCHITHPDGNGQCRMRYWPLLRAALVATMMVLPAAFLAAALLYANWPVLLSLLSIEPPATLENLSALSPDETSILGGLRLDGTTIDGASLVGGEVCVTCRAGVVLGLALLCALIMMMGWRYFRARLWNHRWNTFQIAGYGFDSHLAAGRLMATGFVCDLLTILSLGLYYPFGVVRMTALYREAVHVWPLDDTAPPPSPQPATRRTPLGRLPASLRVRPHLHWLPALLLAMLPLVLVVLMSLYAKSLVGDVLVRAIPTQMQTNIGESTLQWLSREGAGPSALSPTAQQRLRENLQAAVQRAMPGQVLPAYRLVFLKGGPVLGPNALALPGDIIVLTDELLALVAEQPSPAAALIGIFGHELAHLKAHHPQQLLLVGAMRKAVQLVLTGRGEDRFEALGPETFLNLGYNADLVREADQGAIQMLRANDHPPGAMIGLLRALHRARLDPAHPEWALAAQRVPVGLAAESVDPVRMQVYLEPVAGQAEP